MEKQYPLNSRIDTVYFCWRFFSDDEDSDRVPIFISIHVRRTDYEWFLAASSGGQLVSKSYFIEAMNLFRLRYNTQKSRVSLISILKFL